MNQVIKNKRNLLSLTSDLDRFIKDNKWISRYDVDSDSLAITKPKLSKDARIKYFDDEVALYLTKKGVIEGLFIEYFKSNFVEHNKNLKKVIKSIEKNKKPNSSLIKLKKQDLNQITPNIEEEIKTSLAEKIKVSTA